MIEMHVCPTLGYMFTGHNISGVGLLSPLRVAVIVTRVTEVTMGTEWLDDLCIGGVSGASVVVLL
jgi:hypothetical protein